MAIIQSGASSTVWTIDSTSKAGRVTLYDSAGNEVSGSSTNPTKVQVISGTGTGNAQTIDGTSKAGRVTLYDTLGNSLVGYQTPSKAIAIQDAEAVSYAITAAAISSGATTSKVICSLWHTNTSIKDVRLRGIKVTHDAVATATTLRWELFYFGPTTAPSGGTGVTPLPLDPADAAAECFFQTLPSTVGATENAVPVFVWRCLSGIIAASTSELERDGVWLFRDDLSPSLKAPKLRSGQAEGWNLKLSPGTSSTVTTSLNFYITEE